MKDSFEQSEKLRQTELEKAKAESISIIESGKKSLLLEKENILKDIREKAVDIVVSASKATLKGVADEKTDEALIKTAKNNI
jgi:F0F1-type ATP synthase membrane subunit b/b'